MSLTLLTPRGLPLVCRGGLPVGPKMSDLQGEGAGNHGVKEPLLQQLI